MVSKRMIFELEIIYDRLLEMWPDYEQTKPIRQEHIDDILLNKNKGYIRIRFNTYAYMIFVYQNAYQITWFHQDIKDEHKFVHDGTETCKDVSEVVRSLDSFMYSGFCPARSAWWQHGKRPKIYTKSRKWA